MSSGLPVSSAAEFNFDGLVGPTHNYGGLSYGNVASAQHEGNTSNPRQAALQGLTKMRALHELGVPQGVLPPHYRPELGLARRLGFVGDDREVIRRCAAEMPVLLAACYSASSMWTANAATVCPSADSADGKVHFTPANLQNKMHRAIEAPTTGRILRSIFRDEAHFAHHEPLPASAALGDEGAANHTRLALEYGARGVQLFVFGESATDPSGPRPRAFPARQTRESCLGLCRLHALGSERVLVAAQNPDIIDRGVFHNDVISVGNRDVFFYHEESFVDTSRVVSELADKFAGTTGGALRLIEVESAAVSVELAVKSYLFNSQLVTTPDGTNVLVAPRECEESDAVRELLGDLVGAGSGIDQVQYFDLRQSMHGGGGPACLRLRVVLTAEEKRTIAPGVLFDEGLHTTLESWVEKHYRDRLSTDDLADPALPEETRVALDELTGILGLGAIYPFQLP